MCCRQTVGFYCQRSATGVGPPQTVSGCDGVWDREALAAGDEVCTPTSGSLSVMAGLYSRPRPATHQELIDKRDINYWRYDGYLAATLHRQSLQALEDCSPAGYCSYWWCEASLAAGLTGSHCRTIVKPSKGEDASLHILNYMYTRYTQQHLYTTTDLIKYPTNCPSQEN